MIFVFASRGCQGRNKQRVQPRQDFRLCAFRRRPCDRLNETVKRLFGGKTPGNRDVVRNGPVLFSVGLLKPDPVEPNESEVVP